jgi:hypothetical protein
MADVFISYAREDRSVAANLAHALQARGWTVWWDRNIQVGRPFSKVIESELAAARAVIVLWSRASVASEWVAVEASEGNAREILVPIKIDEVRPPLEFRRLHMAALGGWDGAPGHPALSSIFAAIEQLIPASVAMSPSPPAAAAVAPAAPPMRSTVMGAGVVVIALTLLWLAGYTFEIGGALVHLLLIAAVVVVIARVVIRTRRAV